MMMSLRTFLTSLLLVYFSEVPAQQFAVIGDYGIDSPEEASVASMVKGWKPDFIITTGDNNYQLGEAYTIDANIGKHYGDFIFPYKGVYGPGDTINRFFPSLGNHDLYTEDGKAYKDYFTLPGNERYYDYVKGDVHFFVLNSDGLEPDGVDENGVQAMWLKNGLEVSVSIWKIVYFHHSPFSSGAHGNVAYMQWPFRAWGASAVISGHDHDYERINSNGLPYFVNGLGGQEKYAFNDSIPGSMSRYNGNFGAMHVVATKTEMVFRFINILNDTIDTYTLLPQINAGTSKVNQVNLLSVHPNPSRSAVSFSFTVKEPATVYLKIYTLHGEEVINKSILVSHVGKHEITVDTKDLPEGEFLYRMSTKNSFHSGKFIIGN